MIKNLFISSIDKKIDKNQVHNLVKSIRIDLDFKIESLFINFIDSEKIKSINKEFLQHDYSTDVISFNYSERNDGVDGEIFISIEDATEFAKKYKATLNSEFNRLVIHGILHLRGFDDINKNDRSKMKKMENNLLNKYNFTLLRQE